MTQNWNKRGNASQERCPTCGKPRDQRWRPFCSKRCADADLGHWFGERYRIPMVDIEDEDGEAAEAGDAGR